MTSTVTPRRTTIVILFALSALMSQWGVCAALPQLLISCQTDRSWYRPSDSVKILGRVSASLGQPVQSASVWVVATEPSGGYVENAKTMSGSDGNFSDTFTLKPNAATGNYTVSVTATRPGFRNGACQTIFAVSRSMADFTISVNPSAMTIVQRESGNFTIFVSSSTGFTGTVALSVQGIPPASNATINPTSVVPDGSSTLRIATTETTPPGQYSFNIRGEGGLKAHTIKANLTIAPQQPPAGFQVFINPFVSTVLPGGSSVTSVEISETGAYDLPVSLSASDCPAGVEIIFRPVSGVPSFTSTMTVAVGTTVSPGTYTIVITGSGSDGESHSATYTLSVAATQPDFEISVNPSYLEVAAGGEDSAAIRIQPIGLYSQRITLSASSQARGIAVSVDPTSGAGAFSAMLTVHVDADVSVTAYSLVVSAVGGDGKSHSLEYALYVTLERRTSFGELAILSNSTVTDFQVKETLIVFKVNGEHGTYGFSNATLPIRLLNGDPVVLVDGQPAEPRPVVAHNFTHYMVYFTYAHGTPREITIGGATDIPEFNNVLLPILVIAVLAGFGASRKRIGKVEPMSNQSCIGTGRKRSFT